MGLKEDIEGRSKLLFQTDWQTTNADTVPVPTDLSMVNSAKYLSRATVLYADLDGSTDMVDQKKWWFAAEVYKAFLYAAGRVISSSGGAITSYDGDRVMGIFVGGMQTTTAALCALKIHHAVKHCVQPALEAKYGAVFKVAHKVGVDTSPLHAVKTGVRGDNDITWVGRAANHAAKLTAIPVGPESWVTDAAYNQMAASAKVWDGKQIWTKRTWSQMNDATVWASSWTWVL